VSESGDRSGSAPVCCRVGRITSQISGRRALTELTPTFFNPNPRTLEGEPQFPLQDGQTNVAMAMDVNGKLRACPNLIENAPVACIGPAGVQGVSLGQYHRRRP